MRKYPVVCLHGLPYGCVHTFKMHATKQLSICVISVSVGLLLLLSMETRKKPVIQNKTYLSPCNPNVMGPMVACIFCYSPGLSYTNNDAMLDFMFLAIWS